MIISQEQAVARITSPNNFLSSLFVSSASASSEENEFHSLENEIYNKKEIEKEIISSPDKETESTLADAKLITLELDDNSEVNCDPTVNVDSFKLVKWAGHRGAGENNKRGFGSKLQMEERVTAGLLYNIGGNSKDIGETFGVDAHSVVNYSKGKLDNKGEVIPELQQALNIKLQSIQEKAVDKLLESIGYMTPDKLQAADAGELSSIVSNMSKVVERLGSKDAEGVRLKVIVHAEKPMRENQFNTIEVSM